MSDRGIVDLTGGMPASMYEWMSDIKIYVERNLLTHPLYSDINTVLFHSKNKKKDYDKMMGLLKSLSQDLELFEPNISENEQVLYKSKTDRLPRNSETLLNEILESDNPTQMLAKRFQQNSFRKNEELRSLLRELQDKEYIEIPLWADNLPYHIQINNSARTYHEQIPRKLMLEANITTKKAKDYDVFISHANDDKSNYVDELVLAIRKLGINIFYDSDTLAWGDNWKDVILKGTAKSEFAIVIISESFFGREWTERELEEFLQRQNEDKQKVVLPLLHNITFEQLKERYPDLQYIQSIKSVEYSFEDITIMLAKELLKRYKV